MEAAATALRMRKLSLRKDSRLPHWAELTTQAVSHSRQKPGPGKDGARWLLRLCRLLNEDWAFV